MFGSELLDVVIGVVFVFLALSLVASAGVEIIERQLKRRAADLEKGISELLGDPDNAAGFVEHVYNHPLVNSLFAGRYNAADKRNLPSYIPARNFALAVIDIGRKVQSGQIAVPLPANLSGALDVLANQVAGDAVRLEQEVGAWFDTGMDRVSGWYKRRTQMFTFLIGLTVTILVNADTISIVQRLSTDRAVRAGLVAAAQATAQRPASSTDDSVKVIRDQIASLGTLGLPIGPYEGWPPNYWDKRRDKDPDKVSTWFQQWAVFFFNHWPGWLITSVAVSFGAPFWFDALNKLTVIRSTVKPHEKSPEEKSQD